jgi:beta-N-acetylhexosaminidase
VHRRRGRLTAAGLLSAALLLGACGGTGSSEGGPTGGRAAAESTIDPDAPSGWGPTEGELAEASRRVAEMSPAELAATVMMPGFWGYTAEEPTPAEVEANQRMHGVGSAVEAVRARDHESFFLRPEVIADVTQVGELASGLQAVVEGSSGLPALLSIDQEGGTVQRLTEGVEVIPSAAYVGSTGDLDYAREVALDNGETLAGLGVTMVMAPVADVDPDGGSVLGTRSYSPDPEVASRMVVTTVRAYLDAGVIPVVKHFPGLGTVDGDSHSTLPVQAKSLEELQGFDLRPFKAAIEAEAPVMMTGHVDVQVLDPGVPASVSPEVVQGLLRDTMGFEGVAVTDSQGMGPIYAKFGSGEGAVLSLIAGNDLVLNSPEPQVARQAVQDAVADGRLRQERVVEAATRVVALRLYQQRLAQAPG